MTWGDECILLGHQKDLYVVRNLVGQSIDPDPLFDETSLCCSKNFGRQIRLWRTCCCSVLNFRDDGC